MREGARASRSRPVRPSFGASPGQARASSRDAGSARRRRRVARGALAVGDVAVFTVPVAQAVRQRLRREQGQSDPVVGAVWRGSTSHARWMVVGVDQRTSACRSVGAPQHPLRKRPALARGELVPHDLPRGRARRARDPLGVGRMDAVRIDLDDPHVPGLVVGGADREVRLAVLVGQPHHELAVLGGETVAGVVAREAEPPGARL